MHVCVLWGTDVSSPEFVFWYWYWESGFEGSKLLSHSTGDSRAAGSQLGLPGLLLEVTGHPLSNCTAAVMMNYECVCLFGVSFFLFLSFFFLRRDIFCHILRTGRCVCACLPFSLSPENFWRHEVALILSGRDIQTPYGFITVIKIKTLLETRDFISSIAERSADSNQTFWVIREAVWAFAFKVHCGNRLHLSYSSLDRDTFSI